MFAKGHSAFKDKPASVTKGVSKVDRFSFMTFNQLVDECRRLEGKTNETALYEVTSSQVIDPVQVYVWEHDFGRVIPCALASFVNNGYRGLMEKDLKVKVLFELGDEPFCTVPDEGFGVVNYT